MFIIINIKKQINQKEHVFINIQNIQKKQKMSLKCNKKYNKNVIVKKIVIKTFF